MRLTDMTVLWVFVGDLNVLGTGAGGQVGDSTMP